MKTMLLTTAAGFAQPHSTQPPNTGGLMTMMSWLMWGVTFACVAGILVICAQMALSHHHGGASGGQHWGRLGLVVGAAVISGAAAAFINAVS
jgi:hypothetical protein